MAKARKILKRTRAVKNIRDVTKTMEMIASSRFRRAHNKLAAARPYTDRMTDLVACLIARMGTEPLRHPLLREQEELRRDVLLVLTSNRGLCGAMNPSVLRIATARYEQLREAGYEVLLQVVGRRGVRHFRFRGVELDAAHTALGDMPDYDAISAMADTLMAAFLAGEISGVEVAYMQFISAARQRPAIAQVLPLTNLPSPPPSRLAAVGEAAPYDFVPSGDEILDRLLPATVHLRMYQCFLDSGASEQVMRIAAMKTATENADDMLHDLTVRYNRMRQSRITRELTEIAGGRRPPKVPRDLTRQVRQQLKAREGVTEVELTLATEVPPEQMDTIRRKIHQMLGAEPVLKVTVDASLVGGMVMRVGGRVYDASLAAKIRRLGTRVAEQITSAFESRPPHGPQEPQ